MSIGPENERRNITLPKKLWSDLEAEVERLKASTGQKVTISELIQQAIEQAWQAGESETRAWERRVEQVAHDMEVVRVEVVQACQAMHVHLEEVKQGWLTGGMPGDAPTPQTPGDVLREQYRHAAGGESPDPFAAEATEPPEPPRRWWRRGA